MTVDDMIRSGDAVKLALEAELLTRPKNEGQRGFEDPIHEALRGLTLAVIALQQELYFARTQ